MKNKKIIIGIIGLILFFPAACAFIFIIGFGENYLYSSIEYNGNKYTVDKIYDTRHDNIYVYNKDFPENFVKYGEGKNPLGFKVNLYRSNKYNCDTFVTVITIRNNHVKEVVCYKKK